MIFFMILPPFFFGNNVFHYNKTLKQEQSPYFAIKPYHILPSKSTHAATIRYLEQKLAFRTDFL